MTAFQVIVDDVLRLGEYAGTNVTLEDVLDATEGERAAWEGVQGGWEGVQHTVRIAVSSDGGRKGC